MDAGREADRSLWDASNRKELPNKNKRRRSKRGGEASSKIDAGRKKEWVGGKEERKSKSFLCFPLLLARSVCIALPSSMPHPCEKKYSFFLAAAFQVRSLLLSLCLLLSFPVTTINSLFHFWVRQIQHSEGLFRSLRTSPRLAPPHPTPLHFT